MDKESSPLNVESIDINEERLNEQQIEQIKMLLRKYQDIFSASNPGSTNLVYHTIDVGNNKPSSHIPYRTSPSEREIIQREIERMMSENIIQPSKSPWASPGAYKKERRFYEILYRLSQAKCSHKT